MACIFPSVGKNVSVFLFGQSFMKLSLPAQRGQAMLTQTEHRHGRFADMFLIVSFFGDLV